MKILTHFDYFAVITVKQKILIKTNVKKGNLPTGPGLISTKIYSSYIFFFFFFLSNYVNFMSFWLEESIRSKGCWHLFFGFCFTIRTIRSIIKYLYRKNILYDFLVQVRIEDDIAVTSNGCELMTTVPRTVEDIESLMAIGRQSDVKVLI